MNFKNKRYLAIVEGSLFHRTMPVACAPSVVFDCAAKIQQIYAACNRFSRVVGNKDHSSSSSGRGRYRFSIIFELQKQILSCSLSQPFLLFFSFSFFFFFFFSSLS